MSLGYDPSNPFGGPTERSISVKSVDLLLRLVDSGRGLCSLMHPEDQKRYVRLEGLWKWHRRAESMIMSELGRRKRIQAQQQREADELDNLPIVDDEEDEDEEEELDFGL